MYFTHVMYRLRRDIHIKYLLADEDSNELNNFSKKHCIKSNWTPLCADDSIEKMMDDFERVVLSEKSQLRKQNHSNLTKHQENALNLSDLMPITKHA